ncbi:transcriptional regulator ATRX-like protein isoform X2 [Cucumis melo var. makuwa]|uniref:Transcriptional regulator ATRX-like protein isoform X2 n=2 Tax=Cucumis melo TaxID=3656 RepID=A0A5D3BBU9_CUCMM|nr:transcriptional regulator ATRX-like protein isoform X2 [Cucumis melo var. makuwa]
MKLLPSPSCSSSSSFSSSTFDAHVCNPRAAAATPSCLSGILRRILCSGSLPTHPTDHITEETSSVKSDDKVLHAKDLNVIKSTNETKATAGIVARLMGLDSMPEMKQNHNSLLRSQSMNSVEHLYKYLDNKHQQVRSTKSFREVPTFLELENEDYFILSFEGERKSKEFKPKVRNSRAFKQRNEDEDKCKHRGSNKTEQSYVRKTKKKIFDPEEAKQFVLIDLKEKKKSRKRVSRNKPTSRISTKDRHGRKPTRKVESECSSDELSPVSVLDSSEFLRDQEESTQLTGDTASNSPINPRRKLSTEHEIPQNPSRDDDDLIVNGGKIAKTKGIDNGIQRERYEEEICMITEMELGESNWKYSKICEEHQEFEAGGIIEGLDSYILEGLIEEFVEQQMYDLIFI